MDPASVASGSIPPPIPWYQYLSTEVRGFNEHMERIVDKYAGHLDPETLDLLEQLASSPLVFTVDYLPMRVRTSQMMGLQVAQNPFMAEEWDHTMRKHADVFSRIVDIYNEEASDDRKVLVSNKRIWADNVSPAVRSARAVYQRLENGMLWMPPDPPTEQSPE